MGWLSAIGGAVGGAAQGVNQVLPGIMQNRSRRAERQQQQGQWEQSFAADEDYRAQTLRADEVARTLGQKNWERSFAQDAEWQRGETATTGLDLELAALSFAHDEVLQQAARSNVCPQLEVGQHVARLANVARARDELLQRNRLDHGCSPDGMKAQVRITRPTSPKGSLHSHFGIGVCPRDQAASAGRTKEACDTGTNSRVR